MMPGLMLLMLEHFEWASSWKEAAVAGTADAANY